MNKGTSLATRMIEKSLDENIKLEIEMLLKETNTYQFSMQDFSEEISKFSKSLSEDQLLTLKGYTGLYFKKINALLRNNWNYEEHGRKTDEEAKRFREDISTIDELISSFPPNKNAFITYRGSSLNSFKKYGINTLDELIHLKGQYLYEEGYTSTSLDEKESYFNKNINGKINNVETRYIVPPYSNDGIPLTSSELSYSPNQKEYLLERNSLSKVIDVEINSQSAIITVLLIPKKIWNKDTMINKKDNNKTKEL